MEYRQEEATVRDRLVWTLQLYKTFLHEFEYASVNYPWELMSRSQYLVHVFTVALGGFSLAIFLSTLVLHLFQ